MTLGVFFTALGYLTGLAVFFLAARERRLATEGIGWVVLAGACGGVLSARLGEWVLGHREALAARPVGLLDPRLGGRTLIGGLLGGWLAVEATKRRLGIRRSTGDMFALALPAGEAVGRIGCFLNGCCYGVPANIPWAVYQHGAWRHPAQLYATIAALAVLGLLLTIRSRLRREEELFRLYLVLYAASRFGIEYARERRIAFAGLSLAQWICLEIVVGVAAAWLLRRHGVPPRS